MAQRSAPFGIQYKTTCYALLPFPVISRYGLPELYGTMKRSWLLIEEYPNVVAYINGHYHYGNYGFRNGIHYIDQAGMLLTQETNSFSVLEVIPENWCSGDTD